MNTTALIHKADGFAAAAHFGQKRKVDLIEFITHPRAVAKDVQELGGDEIAVAAALLHDVIEDTVIDEATIRAEFGDAVADAVMACTEVGTGAGQPKAPWRDRKESYLAHLLASYQPDRREASLPPRRVAFSDKRVNGRDQLASLDAAEDSSAVWGSFSSTPAEQGWWWQAIATEFEIMDDLPADARRELREIVDAICVHIEKAEQLRSITS